MGSVLSIIGLFILAVLKLEQFVYGKSGKEQSTTDHIARRGLANIAGLIAFDHATVNSKSIVVRKKRKVLRNEHLSSFFAYIEKSWKNISINLKITLAILNDICYYIDKDRYRYGAKYTNVNIFVKYGTQIRRT
nr:hypothetical protein [Veillonella parvula]